MSYPLPTELHGQYGDAVEMMRAHAYMVADHKKVARAAKLRAGKDRGWVILALLALVVAFTGGASRSDAIQIVALRSLSAVFLIPPILYIRKEDVASNRLLLTLFGCFVLLVALQLVPLPASLWQNLPGRSDIYRLDVALGLDGIWRPLTLAPMRTWNVLGSLVVPAAGLLLAVGCRASSLTLLRLVAALGILNALTGLLQIATGRSSALYFYEMTNRGSPVGIFANENHASVFAACAMLVVATLGFRVRKLPVPAWEKLAYPPAFFLILLVSLAGGSRAGFAASMGAICMTIVMLALSGRPAGKQSARNLAFRWMDSHPRLLLVFPVLIMALIAVAFIALDRAPAFDDILKKDSLDDLRWSLWSVLAAMLKAHWLFGSGFGSFEQVYHIYEPPALLIPQYINQAHNDWAQMIIEGGVAAGGLLIILVAWIGRAIIAISLRRERKVEAVFWMSILAIVGLASLVDYPLRTPIFQLVTVWLLIVLSRDVRDLKAT